jgi:hypothetical protein
MSGRAEPEFGPSSCGQCGFPQRGHWFTHDFAKPTDTQILARMRNRRALCATPDLLALPPIGATRLGHALVPCDMSKKVARRILQTPVRWYCRDCGNYCGNYCGRSGGIETGAAAIYPCTTSPEYQ